MGNLDFKYFIFMDVPLDKKDEVFNIYFSKISQSLKSLSQSSLIDVLSKNNLQISEITYFYKLFYY
jgi:hypothetical protein